jgi:hypothetical protein
VLLDSVPFKRAVVFDNDFVDGSVVVAQRSHYVFRISAFGEAGEAAQVTEQRRNLSTMAFKLLPRAGPLISSATWPHHPFDFTLGRLCAVRVLD